MRQIKIFLTNAWIVLVPLWLSCVDKVQLELEATQLPIIVDGFVTVDNQHPDTVKLALAYPADGAAYPVKAIVGAKMAITDDAGVVDSLTDIGKGKYITNTLEGAVGRTYRLTIRLKDPATGENTFISSSPQLLVDAGAIDSIYYEYTTRKNPDTDLPENGFNIYINATLSPTTSHRMLWEFFGTYTTTTDPSVFLVPIGPCPDPPACPVGPLPCSVNCDCCTCWYNTFEKAPIVSSPEVISGQQISHVFMQYIPINANTFFEKYRVEIGQKELAADVFDFYKSIRNQADNSTSLFQPPFSELRGNITVDSGPIAAIGTFAASTIARKHIYIPRSAVPYEVSVGLISADCRNVAENSTNVKPPYWQ